MKKIIGIVLTISLMCLNPCHAATNWMKGTGEEVVLGTETASNLDDVIYDNIVAPLDLLLKNYRRDMRVVSSSSTTVNVLAGELVISNSAGTISLFVETTSTTSVGWGDIDAGAEAASTQYYVYAYVDAVATTTASYIISTSSSAPTGKTYYKKIGYFYNNSSSNIVDVGNYKGGNVDNVMVVTGATDISVSGTTPALMAGMTAEFVSNGGLVSIDFVAGIHGSTGYGHSLIYIDSADKTGKMGGNDSSNEGGLAAQWAEVLTAGVHTIEVYWSCEHASYIMHQKGSTEGKRVLIIRES